DVEAALAVAGRDERPHPRALLGDVRRGAGGIGEDGARGARDRHGGTLAADASHVNRPITLRTSVTETEGVASKPVLPNHAPERGPCDRASAPGIRGGDAPPL